MEDDGDELEPIKWPDEEAIEVNPWADMAMFTQDSILLAGEPVQATWLLDSGATHHITACWELLRGTRKLEEPKVFGLADRTASMKASEVGEVHVRLPAQAWLDHRHAQWRRNDQAWQGTTHLAEGWTSLDDSDWHGWDSLQGQAA
jgi:hypothetical protein